MASVALASIPSNANIAGVLYGVKWTSPLTYSFPDSEDDYDGYGPGFGFNEFMQVSVQQQKAIQAIIEGLASGKGAGPLRYGSFESVCKIVIGKAADVEGVADIMFGECGSFGLGNLSSARVTQFPTVGAVAPIEDADVFFGNDYVGTVNDYRTPQAGNYAWQTIIHEIGHALGLKHGHNDGSPINTVRLPHARNSHEFSVMTYDSYVGAPDTDGSPNERWGYPQTLMMNDIAALQHLYGADYSTNSGNTTYTWSPTTGQMFVNGFGQGAPGGNRVFLTIWDGGGRDKYDMSNYSNDVRIDLEPGMWSITSNTQRAELAPFKDARGTVFNAYLHKNDGRSYIEDAEGGSGDDFIAGNPRGNKLWGNNGEDTLYGYLGSDQLFGGKHDDRLIGHAGDDIYSTGAGADVVVLRATLSASTNVDRFKDFSPANDTIELDKSYFADIGSKGKLGSSKFHVGSNAHDRSDRVIYKASTGDLYYDRDGNRSAPKVKIAEFDGNPDLTRHDFLVVA